VRNNGTKHAAKRARAPRSAVTSTSTPINRLPPGRCRPRFTRRLRAYWAAFRRAHTVCSPRCDAGACLCLARRRRRPSACPEQRRTLGSLRPLIAVSARTLDRPRAVAQAASSVSLCVPSTPHQSRHEHEKKKSTFGRMLASIVAIACQIVASVALAAPAGAKRPRPTSCGGTNPPGLSNRGCRTGLAPSSANDR
jgi:hypothetical protein